MEQVIKIWLAAAMLGMALCPAQLFAATGWTSPSEADAKAGRELGKALDSAFASGELENLHSVLVVRNHSLVLERYYSGRDESWGRVLDIVQFTPDTLHDLRSVTKSIVSLLYGIALADGAVPTLETPVVSQFPSYADLASDPARRRITIEHLLTMTMGLAWNEDLPYTDARNSEIAMENAPDRYRFVLSHSVLGLLHMVDENFDEAVVSARKAVSLDPNSAQAFTDLALVLIYAGRASEATPAMETALRLEPNPPHYYL